jgi:uncharacterized damage-inducible protein DinB
MPVLARPVADERDGLLSYLEHMREMLRVAAYGLTDEQIALTPTASALSIGGLIKHVAHAERTWMDTVLQRERGSRDAYEAAFRVAPGETVEQVLQLYDDAARNTTAVISGIDGLGQPVPVPQGVPWFPPDVESWSVRWVLLHLIQETARHAGHADIIRESIDGATAMALMAAAEHWPPTPWLQPWQPASSD